MSFRLCRTPLVGGSNPVMFRTWGTKAREDADEREKMKRLEQAERDLFFLQIRASRAISLLESRQRRNHWRESIEEMIQGGF